MEPISEIIEKKQQKLKELRDRGVNPYPPRFSKTHSAQEILSLPLGTAVTTAGRLVLIREMGKASFAHLQDSTGRIQIYLKRDKLGEDAYHLFTKDIHVGDFIGMEGVSFKTKTGETTIEVASLTLLSKSLRPLPEKWHGLKDAELRQRHRHLDLISSPEVKSVFEARSRIISAIRKSMDEMGFLEVETPILLAQAGGATAKPFSTHHKALDMQLHLRIATELYLKRLIIGGFEKVYEIGRIFRNEGIDTRHNPEFTMLEAYQAYADYHTMAELLEGLLTHSAESCGKKDIKPPFARLALAELWKKYCGEDIHQILSGKSFNRTGLIALARKHSVEANESTPSAKIFERIFDACILPELKEPVFIMDHPTAITPLAKLKPGDESLVERFEFFFNGQELANAYTELNDPVDQRERFVEQKRQREKEQDDEAEILDEEFVQAMEHGMPPTGGIGIGIDRLAMVLLDQESIREVILFPTLKAEGLKSD
ncbi:MAG: lysine--tRNA ligase [Elusimicrobia bacterium]|nr:lysine--tRNA ligase [Elusimicrobiota bacterium]